MYRHPPGTGTDLNVGKVIRIDLDLIGPVANLISSSPWKNTGLLG